MNKEKQPKPNYNFDIQKLYLEMFLSDAETFVRCQNIFDPLNFDQRLQNIATFINKYVDEYKVMPEANIVNASTGSDLNPVQLPKENYEWLMDEFENFSRHKGLERAIIESSDLLEAGDYGPVEKLIKDALTRTWALTTLKTLEHVLLNSKMVTDRLAQDGPALIRNCMVDSIEVS